MSELPWFKFYTEAFRDPKFISAAIENQMEEMTVFGIWTALLCIAAKSKTRGKLLITEDIGYSIAELEKYIGWYGNLSTGDLGSLIKSFIGLDMIAIDDNGCYIIINFEERQDIPVKDSKSPGAIRTQHYRERLKEKTSQNVTSDASPLSSTSISISSSLSDSLIFNDIKSHFEQLTGLPVLPQAIKAIDEIIAFGGTPADITEGYKWFKDNSGKPLKYYGQLVGPTRTAMSKRLNGNGYKPAKSKAVDIHATAEGMQKYGDWETK